MALTPLDLSIRFFLQLVVILAACQATGWVFRRIGQSQVVSEMITGVLLGPSLFGLLLPDVQRYFFPKESMTIRPTPAATAASTSAAIRSSRSSTSAPSS